MQRFMIGFIAAIVSIALFRILDPVVTVCISSIVLFAYALFILKDNITFQYGIAFLLAFAWTWSANHLYLYTRFDWHVLNIPVFPLISWAVGLTTLWVLYSGVMKTFKFHKKFSFMIWYGIYLPALVGIETIGYHWFNIRLITHYNGLPFFDCLHVPWWMKLVYFSMGGAYYFLLSFCERVSFISRYKVGGGHFPVMKGMVGTVTEWNKL